MNDPLNFFDEMRFIFTFALLVAPASLTEAIPDKNAGLLEPCCSWTRAIGVGSERKFVPYSKTLGSGRDPPVGSCSSLVSGGSDECLRQ